MTSRAPTTKKYFSVARCDGVVQNPGPRGFGRAVRYGLERFTGDAVVIAMADASDDPEDVVRYHRVLRVSPTGVGVKRPSSRRHDGASGSER